MAELRRLPAPITTVWDWQMHAACRETDAGVFFHPAHERGPAAAARDAAAKRVCAVCPVIEECGLHALLVQEPYGVWGGLTAGERHELLRAGPSALRRLTTRTCTRTRPEECAPLMADFHASTTVNADAAALFAFLSDIRNLPRYFSRMTAARPGDGNEVHTEAQTPDGTRVEGDAWFEVDRDARRIAWGSEGPGDYRGSLEVTDIGTGSGPGSQVTVWLHTTRVPDHDGTVQGGLDATVAAVRQLVEEHYAIT
ncbi:WhiB family transcriptional regulator [Pseudonocardia alni]|uniref:WhiB family transcriptional regulator n=1 Tax=Pseudonocardia alni TaxID=33907 RepID=UPI00331AC1DE